MIAPLKASLKAFRSVRTVYILRKIRIELNHARIRSYLMNRMVRIVAIFRVDSWGGRRWQSRVVGEKTFNTGICGTWPGYLQIAGGVMRIETVCPPGDSWMCISTDTDSRYTVLREQSQTIICFIKSGRFAHQLD